MKTWIVYLYRRHGKGLTLGSVDAPSQPSALLKAYRGWPHLPQRDLVARRTEEPAPFPSVALDSHARARMDAQEGTDAR